MPTPRPIQAVHAEPLRIDWSLLAAPLTGEQSLYRTILEAVDRRRVCHEQQSPRSVEFLITFRDVIDTSRSPLFALFHSVTLTTADIGSRRFTPEIDTQQVGDDWVVKVSFAPERTGPGSSYLSADDITRLGQNFSRILGGLLEIVRAVYLDTVFNAGLGITPSAG